jgi:hypothetical protein
MNVFFENFYPEKCYKAILPDFSYQTILFDQHDNSDNESEAAVEKYDSPNPKPLDFTYNQMVRFFFKDLIVISSDDPVLKRLAAKKIRCKNIRVNADE